MKLEVSIIGMHTLYKYELCTTSHGLRLLCTQHVNLGERMKLYESTKEAYELRICMARKERYLLKLVTLDTSDCASPSAAAAAPSVTLSLPKTPSEGRFYRTKDGQFSARPRFDVLLNFVLYNQACMFKIVKTSGRQYSSCSCG